MASMSKTEVAARLSAVVAELASLRDSLAFPIAAHLPITPGVMERLTLACNEIQAVHDAEIADDAPAVEPESEAAPDAIVSLVEGPATEVMPGVTAAQRDALVAAGFVTVDDIRNATDDDLLAVEGVGPATVERLREATNA